MIALAFAAVLALSGGSLRAGETATVDHTAQFREAGFDVDQLKVLEVGGIVVIRGRTFDPQKAAAAGVLAHRLGYARIANLVQILEPVNDSVILRVAERELSRQRSLDGCKFHVASRQGVVRVAGTVRYELQKDMAVAVLRSIDGVTSVESTLKR